MALCLSFTVCWCQCGGQSRFLKEQQIANNWKERKPCHMAFLSAVCSHVPSEKLICLKIENTKTTKTSSPIKKGMTLFKRKS